MCMYKRDENLHMKFLNAICWIKDIAYWFEIQMTFPDGSIVSDDTLTQDAISAKC